QIHDGAPADILLRRQGASDVLEQIPQEASPGNRRNTLDISGRHTGVVQGRSAGKQSLPDAAELTPLFKKLRCRHGRNSWHERAAVRKLFATLPHSPRATRAPRRPGYPRACSAAYISVV